MYLKIIDQKQHEYSISQLKKDNPNVSFPSQLTSQILSSFDVFQVKTIAKLDFDNTTEKISKNGFKKQGADWVENWQVIDLSIEELNQKKQAKKAKRKAERATPANLINALEVLTKKVIVPVLDELTKVEITKLAVLFPDYDQGVAYTTGDVLNFDGVVLKVLQDHTSQAGSAPDKTPEFYEIKSN